MARQNFVRSHVALNSKPWPSRCCTAERAQWRRAAPAARAGVLAIALMALTAGCSTGGGEGGDELGDIPQELASVESLAEDAFDEALLGNASNVFDLATQLRTDWDAYRPEGVDDGALPADLQQIDAAIVALLDVAAVSVDPVELGRASNAISAPMPQLFDLYAPIVPVELLALDFDGREVILDAIADDFPSATTNVDVIEATWAAFKSEVIDAGGTLEAGQYDAVIVALRAAITATDAIELRAQSNISLDLVDAIEALFGG